MFSLQSITIRLLSILLSSFAARVRLSFCGKKKKANRRRNATKSNYVSVAVEESDYLSCYWSSWLQKEEDMKKLNRLRLRVAVSLALASGALSSLHIHGGR